MKRNKTGRYMQVEGTIVAEDDIIIRSMFEDDVKVVANYMAKTGKAKRKLQRDLLAQIKLTNTIKNGFVLEKGKDIYERHMIGYAEAEDDKLYVCIFDNFKTKEIVRECEKVGPKLEELEALE